MRREESVFHDQASGLRALLRQKTIATLMLAGNVAYPLKSIWLLALAKWLNSQGNQVLILDESRAELTQSLGLHVRYELLHLLEGDKKINQVAINVSDGIQIIPAARGLSELAKLPNGFLFLQQAFNELPLSASRDAVIRPNCLLINSQSNPSSVLIAGLTQQIETWLLGGTDPAAFTDFFAQLKYLNAFKSADLGIAMHATHPKQTIHAFQYLKKEVRQWFGTSLSFRGWLNTFSNVKQIPKWYPYIEKNIEHYVNQ